MLKIAQTTISTTAKTFLVTIFTCHAKNSWTHAEMIPLDGGVRCRPEVKAAMTYSHGRVCAKDWESKIM